MDDIQFLFGSKAVDTVRKLNISDRLIYQWYTDKGPSCYILYNNKKPVSFALLSKMDFDPLKKHTNPKTLNYIFTLEEHRRKGYAKLLVEHLKESNQFSTFCSNDASEDLFRKCNCIEFGEYNNTAMFRYP